MKDSQGNLINVTIFESYFSKYLIEHPDFFKPVYMKIIDSIQELTLLNSSNSKFDRVIFSIFSILPSEFAGYNTIDDLKSKFNLFACNYFFKLFCDRILPLQLISVFPQKKPTSTILSLSVLCQLSLFKQNPTINPLSPFLKPTDLFQERNRGALLIPQEHIITTRKLGITTLETTPTELINYFPEPYEPSQFEYRPNRKSNVGRWLSKYNLPIISGSSGSARDLLNLILKFIHLETSEIKLLLISQAAVLVAQGHHSYFEVMLFLDRIGCKFQDAPDLMRFYEQTIPVSIKTSDSYLQFKNSEFGSIRLENLPKNSDTDNNFKELPLINIAV
ncbi:MAG: hypothetical protein WC627_10740 [Legionella sp.]|jgi:hypothetical protein